MTENEEHKSADTRPAYLNNSDFWDFFWQHVKPVPTDYGLCLKWTGGKLSKERQYGNVPIARYTDENYDKTKELAHIVRLLDAHGPIPRNKECDHLCTNKWCCRLDHLELVTHAQNIQRFHDRHPDFHDPGSREGENNPNHKLYADEVIYLHRAYHLDGKTHEQLAEELDIYPSYVSEILHARVWSHIDPNIPEEDLRFIDYNQWSVEDIEWLLGEYHSTERRLEDIAAEIEMSYSYALQIVSRVSRTEVEIPVDERRENTNTGSLHWRSEFTTEDIHNILEWRYVDGDTYKEIADRFDHDPSTNAIGGICRRENWQHPPIPDHIQREMPEKYVRYPDGR